MNCIGKLPAISIKTALRVFLCKDAFDLWWQWAERPHESLLMIDADIHNPIMELSLKIGGTAPRSMKRCAGIEKPCLD